MNFVWIGVGALMLFGSFAAINSASSSKFDHDMSLILMIAGMVVIGIGFDVISIDSLKSLMPQKTE